MLSKKTAFLLLFLTALLWSSSGVLVKSVSWNPLAIAGGRGLVAGLTVLALSLPRVKFRHFGPGHILTAFFYASLSITFVCAVKLTSVANALALQFTAPLWVAFLAPWVLKERARLSDWIFLAVMFGGVFLFFQGGLSRSGFWGNILALSSGFFFGAQALSLRFIKDRSPALAIVLGNILAFFLTLGFFRPPYPDLKGFLFILALGVFQMGVSYFLYTLAVPFVSSLELVVITMAEPILSPLWAFLLIGERPSGYALLGGGVVLSAVLAFSVMGLKRDGRPPAGGAEPPPRAALEEMKTEIK
ncbi:MAG: DMT family transporter [Deltaproteobacteria bacterium]|jgi:drug/metabolite transporter (DMT)-like permease|nr:DMT family transporter [Deltaproteobacteria bacterium]